MQHGNAATVLLALIAAVQAAPNRRAPPRTLAQGFTEGLAEAGTLLHDVHQPVLPRTLALVGVSAGRVAKSVAAISDTTLMAFTLVGIPLVLTMLAFFIVGRLGSAEEKPPYPSSRPPPLQPQAKLRSAPPSQLSVRPSLPAQRGSIGNGYPLGSAPPTLPVLSRPGSALLPGQWPSYTQRDEETRQSPLTMALFVKNPNGVAVRLDGTLTTSPENRTVNVMRIKDGSVILTARVAEGKDSSTIDVTVPAKDGKAECIAMLDTRDALQPARNGQQNGRRQVALHRVDAYGPHEEPCAWIIPAAGSGTFFVYYAAEAVFGAWAKDPALTIFTKGGSVEIDRMTDAQGEVIVASEGPAAAVAPNGLAGLSALWVKEGVDMALVTCVVLSVQKLGVPAPPQTFSSRPGPGRASRTRCGPC
mmetsp:Transcript_20173/g.35378  ORF Transcript_20173/g.35378 Transcript_20173/m.35378 type:complete len:417 (+) Transcript_20173:127-1377(+)